MKTLYVLAPFSHYCDAARWALIANGEEANVRIVAYNPGAHIIASPVERLREAGGGKKNPGFPLLLDASGNVEGLDSWSIVERRGQVPPRAKELLDSVVGPIARAIYYEHYFKDADSKAMFKSRCQNVPIVSFWQRMIWYTPFADQVCDVMFNSMVKSAQHMTMQRQKLSDAFDELEPLLYQPPFTLETTGASIALAALVYPLVVPTKPTPPSLELEAQHWRQHPIGKFSLAMYEKFPHFSHNYYP
uniref:GST N-terminal domain-containing protein n=1 Tax=Aureoumbra lagunensis TaxID=44058 RepID=A0A7S3NJA4_9STRA|mmetsp:Transcript_15979/g.20982  ORF Transcript_15979/g.20982 Transcript_15979/m.20982 type:complete len:246 (+) Transcript_15979:103-840(+)|eukprot:CAMPEP_0197289294 /NCGR_PEP_ID=MMETSP0890-20130614/6528_1 /TAXON_ID=44058 ORGANISM="Aureoumbra lagunensis, Strain CCMP1510" /NCGR_SAMPLE_ID=MMETSP0890 /ASSEMBLY_ACC=CAM_ASM_000533 /LENGTH=245 /DNA_ID=CAMNT_0042760601 /DNA_START=89 /DNA_END=826 /DNA_ORIENTATION=+